MPVKKKATTKKVIKKNTKVYCYPIYENWIDIGNKVDYKKNK